MKQNSCLGVTAKYGWEDKPNKQVKQIETLQDRGYSNGIDYKCYNAIKVQRKEIFI